MGVQTSPPNSSLQRYSDRMSQLFSSGSPEPSNVHDPSRSVAGSIGEDCHYQQTDVQSDDEGMGTSMDECSDEEITHRAIKHESAAEHGHRYVKPPNPGHSRGSKSTIIDCMAESIEDSLKSQDLWNKAMQQKVGHMMDSIDSARKEVAALKEKKDNGKNSAVEDRKDVRRALSSFSNHVERKSKPLEITIMEKITQ
ncbi:hypothetical protein N7517_002625 [Penicillium concentricum]|uniref:Uncharacterized protein n=1 Tax=Penicillium concentricum TaxID=293559 RepID=A0A9W9VKW0_9EURO|nr:uncharacterized protein N7517_002625 [Penicillium concentricum]KAJ5384714.1 hypothetical protein N7517_002625 [Penicillium concentricum]